MSNETRQPAGVPAGGQFATARRTEPQVALTGESVSHRAAVDQMTGALGRALAVDPSTIESRIDAGHACGRPHGNADVDLTVLLNDDLHGEVTLAFETTPDGGFHDTRCTVQYDIEPIGGYDRDSVTSKLGSNEPVNDASIALLIADTHDQARMQRTAETLINRPQHEANVAAGSTRSYLNALRVEVVAGGSGPAVEVVNHSTNSRVPKVRFELEPGTGTITGGWMDTTYGNVWLEDGNLDRVAGEIDRSLAIELRQYTGEYRSSRAQLEARFAAIVA